MRVGFQRLPIRYDSCVRPTLLRFARAHHIKPAQPSQAERSSHLFSIELTKPPVPRAFFATSGNYAFVLRPVINDGTVEGFQADVLMLKRKNRKSSVDSLFPRESAMGKALLDLKNGKPEAFLAMGQELSKCQLPNALIRQLFQIDGFGSWKLGYRVAGDCRSPMPILIHVIADPGIDYGDASRAQRKKILNDEHRYHNLEEQIAGEVNFAVDLFWTDAQEK